MKAASRLALCVVLGFALSVLVAWMGAVSGRQPASIPGDAWARERRATTQLPRPVDRFVPMNPDGRHEASGEASVAIASGWGWRVRREQHILAYYPGAESKAYVTRPVEVYATGWPFTALEWTELPGLWAVSAPPPSRTALERAWELGIEYHRVHPASLPVDERWRRLPIRPSRAGLGLAADTAVWGAVVAGVVTSAGAVRMRRRRRRGLCTACGYVVRDAAGVVLQRCPECGADVEPARAPEIGAGA